MQKRRHSYAEPFAHTVTCTRTRYKSATATQRDENTKRYNRSTHLCLVTLLLVVLQYMMIRVFESR